MTIVPISRGGTNNFSIPDVSASAGFNALTFDSSQTTSYGSPFKSAAYRITIDVSYAQAAQNPSYWNNSQHRFVFSGF